MANAVLIAKINSGYDDVVETRYHFPKMYLSRIEQTVGDWISRTVHWLFDRGFLSLEDNGTILQASRLVPDPVKRLLNPEGRIHLPNDRNSAPHSVFLKWHRDNKFKG